MWCHPPLVPARRTRTRLPALGLFPALSCLSSGFTIPRLLHGRFPSAPSGAVAPKPHGRDAGSRGPSSWFRGCSEAGMLLLTHGLLRRCPLQ